MAKYNIKSLNFVSYGPKRGMLNLDVTYDGTVGKHIKLLDRTFNNGSEISVSQDGTLSVRHGIITESGKYEYARQDYIGIYDANGNLSAIAISNFISNDVSTILLNEQQSTIILSSLSGSTNYISSVATSSLEANSPFAIRLMTEADISNDIDIETYLQWNEEHRQGNLNLIFDMEEQNEKSMYKHGGYKTYPMYDIRDISFKSGIYKQDVNSRVPRRVGQGDTEYSTNDTQDVYFCTEENPVEFCQYRDASNTYAFILTQRTSREPYYLQSNLKWTDSGSNKATMSYSYSLSSDEIKTRLYANKSEYGSCSSLMEVFGHKHSIQGIKYNYLIPMVEGSNGTIEDEIVYEDGNIPFGVAYTAKNTFDPMYRMNMDYLSAINNCRTYCGIQGAEKKLMLKYYDNIKYETGLDKSTQEFGDATEGNMCDDGKYPYQKVEYMVSVNSKKLNKHKSNLFSIKIKYSGLEESEDSIGSRTIGNKIRTDIRNNIREFVNHICPANTQLFDTMFV